ncbi:MAG: hypothetical protein K9H16_14675 [Bacteroidales bacterium]|nr:hypothetical protein [Bacteroidales bacterium]
MKSQLLVIIFGLSFSFSFGLYAQSGNASVNEDTRSSDFFIDKMPGNYNIKADSIIADFVASDTLISENETISFTNLSTGGPTFFKWHFPGASPSVSYTENPVVLYHSPGFFNVTLVVTGMQGSDTLIKENYIEVLPVVTSLPPGWEYEETMTKHSVIMSLSANPRIFEIPIQAGDFIGVFYMSDGDTLRCGGAVEWNDTASVAIVTQGDNPLTPVKDGFSYYEDFNFIIYSSSQQEEFPATPTFDPLVPFHSFFPGTFSVLTDLYSGQLAQIVVPQGWSSISSPVIPWYNLMDSVFCSSQQDLILISDGENIYQPQSGLNMLKSWENKAYLVKMNNEVTLTFKGYPPQNLGFDIQPGWNFLPVPVDCEVDIATLFQDNMDKVKVIKEIAGFRMFWPEHSILSLNELIPGKAYALFADSSFSFQFSPCE